VTWLAPRAKSTRTAGIPAITYEGTTTASQPPARAAIAAGDRRTAHTAATANAANGDLVAAAAPSSAPAATQRASEGRAAGGR